jgi:ubiquinone biosynthesis protein
VTGAEKHISRQAGLAAEGGMMKVSRSLRRFGKILHIAVHHLIIHFLSQWLSQWPPLLEKLPNSELTGPERFRLAFEEIGGTFIKFGQMMALQSDLLPLEYCRALFTLFDRVPPFAYEEVERTFLEDLARKPSEVFDSFNPVPIATGSIGQVHLAALKSQKIAVKVRRPTILADFHADIAALKFTVNTVKILRLKFLYWIIPPTEEFIAWTHDELDFRREAHYMDELGRNARNNPNEKVPVVFWSCTTARILSVEFLEGITISEHLRNQAAHSTPAGFQFDPYVFSSRLIDNFLGDAFRHGMFHADLHPGNLMIMSGNVVGYIDFGISGVLSRYSRRHLISMTLAYARGDLESMCESFFQITTFAKNANVPGFRKGLREVAGGWYREQRSNESRLRKSITLIMLDLLILSRENGIWPQRDIIKYIRSAIALDGLVKTFSPDIDVGKHLEQACERHIKEDSLRNLISSDVLSGWFGGSRNIIYDGILRGFAALHHLGNDPSARQGVFLESQQKKNSKTLVEILSLVWIVLCMALTIWLDRGAMRSPNIYVMAAVAVMISAVIGLRAMKAVRSS